MAGPRRRLRRLTALAGLASLGPLSLLLGGCQLGYFGHLAAGQIEVLRARQPVDALIAAPDTDSALRARLESVRDARAFAVSALALPESDSFAGFVQLDRAYPLWNVFAAPELSLVAREWCYLLTGCLAYRGYYDEAKARAEAERLDARGFDTHVSGVPAYSTLGWFDDPLLWSMLHWDDATLIETLFHELAHERLFIEGDTTFNESFASFVGREGLRQWRASGAVAVAGNATLRCRHAVFVELVGDTREMLEAIYASEQPNAVKRAAKHAAIDDLRARYRRIRDVRWKGFDGFDDWFDAPINNAKLLPVGLYNEWVPAFTVLFDDVEGDWSSFHEAVAKLGARKEAARRDALQSLNARAADRMGRAARTAC